jgi:hypothetical protein
MNPKSRPGIEKRKDWMVKSMISDLFLNPKVLSIANSYVLSSISYNYR